jgi:hypothetical protein
MRPLKHGYTNRTIGDGSVVEKTYEGPDVGIRRAREYALLTRLQGKLPVPPVRGVDDGVLTLGFVAGAPGQELVEAGHAAQVLEACGVLLRRIHETAPSVLGAGAHDAGKVLVHGDFGPNNVLVDPVPGTGGPSLSATQSGWRPLSARASSSDSARTIFSAPWAKAQAATVKARMTSTTTATDGASTSSAMPRKRGSIRS